MGCVGVKLTTHFFNPTPHLIFIPVYKKNQTLSVKTSYLSCFILCISGSYHIYTNIGEYNKKYNIIR